MSEHIELIDPSRIHPNPHNPRLIFRADELQELQESINSQGILVPLTVYKDGKQYFLLDGERRWRCAVKLGMNSVPVIILPKPNELTNLMMMFAIHNTRRDWDPLPTAMKLKEIESLFEKRNGRAPKEKELAGLSSLGIGEVRRLKKILNLPEQYRSSLQDELIKPRSQQKLTVDHVVEAFAASESLRKRNIISTAAAETLTEALIQKLRNGLIKSTVAPRKIVMIARSVDEGKMTKTVIARVVNKLTNDPSYTIDDALGDSIQSQLIGDRLDKSIARMIALLSDYDGQIPAALKLRLRDLETIIHKLLRD